MLSVRRDGALLRVTLNRPEKRNALALALLDELGTTFRTAASDDSIGAAVLTGAGDKAFAAGGDLHELDAVRSPAATAAMAEGGRAALAALRAFPAPVVAALNGAALGGGAELAMACDLRIAAPGAVLGFLQAELNVTTAWGGGIDLLAAAGPARGLELLASARRLSAAQALALGLVQELAPANQPFDEFVDAFLGQLLRRPARVLRAQKALAAGYRARLHAELAATEATGFIAAWTHPDHWSAAAAALNPARKPG